MGRVRGARGLIAAASAAGLLLWAPSTCFAQGSTPRSNHPDALSRALLFGAAYAHSDLSTQKPGGMMFLPGRGLIRWETRGKTLAQQEELKTEAIGRADARAIKAEIDAKNAVIDQERHRVDAESQLAFEKDGRKLPALNLAPVLGTRREAGAIVALGQPRPRPDTKTRMAQTFGVHNGAQFQDKSRVYLFGAVSGRGVGMNLMHDDGSGWKNAGFSTDKGGFVGQRQAGLAIRKGGAQAALSWVREKTRAQTVGITAVKDHRAMLNFTYVPGFRVR